VIVPIALLLNIFLPNAIILILILGGFYLAFEGVEKIVEYFFHQKKTVKIASVRVNEQDAEFEKNKIKSAIVTDFILSIEIVIIALSTVLDKELNVQILTLSIVSIIATVGVYGIVALIVRMDDVGFKMIEKSKRKGILYTLGVFLVNALPIVIKTFSVAGTIALLLVSGGIFAHNIDYLHHILVGLPAIIKELTFGIIGGLFTLVLVTMVNKVLSILKRKNL